MLAAFLFYLLGGLGVKIFGLVKIWNSIKSWRKALPVLLFLSIAAIISFILTHTLLMRSNYFYATYNFFAVFLIVVSMFAAWTITDWTKKQKTLLAKAVFTVLVLGGLGATAFSFLAYFPEYAKYKVITRDELAAIDYLKRNSGQEAVILTDALDRDWVSQKDQAKLKGGEGGRDSFISAMTARRTVLECAWHMAIGSYAPDLPRRKSDVVSFFKTLDRVEAERILRHYKVNYVWLGSGRKLFFDRTGLLKEIYSSADVKIYKVSP